MIHKNSFFIRVGSNTDDRIFEKLKIYFGKILLCVNQLIDKITDKISHLKS